MNQHGQSNVLMTILVVLAIIALLIWVAPHIH